MEMPVFSSPPGPNHDQAHVHTFFTMQACQCQFGMKSKNTFCHQKVIFACLVMLKCMEWNHDLALRNHVLAMDIMDLFSKSTFSQKSRFAIVLSNSPLSLPSTGCSLKFLINKRSRFDAQNLVLVMIDCLMNQNSYALDSET